MAGPDADHAAIEKRRPAGPHPRHDPALPEGYDTVLGESGVALSEGEKQRITIARALLRDAPILILDEPTSALDVETEALVMEGIERLMQGRTTFIIAHRLSTVRRCDLILVLRDGIDRRARHAHDQLLPQAAAFAEYYHTQFAPERTRPPGTVRNLALILSPLAWRCHYTTFVVAIYCLRNLKASGQTTLQYSVQYGRKNHSPGVPNRAAAVRQHTGIVATVVRLLASASMSL